MKSLHHIRIESPKKAQSKSYIPKIVFQRIEEAKKEIKQAKEIKSRQQQYSYFTEEMLTPNKSDDKV